MPKAKDKTDHIAQGCGEGVGKNALSPVTHGRTQAARHRLLALLPFALCLWTFAFSACLLPTALHAQGCAMCYTSASAARSTAKAALADGTLILLLPPMVFFVLIAVVIYRYRNRFREESVVTGQWPVVGSPWSADQDRKFRIPQEIALELSAEGGVLEDYEGRLTADHGRRPTNLQFPRARQ